MKKILNVAIIDDEKIAREGLASYIEKIPFLSLAGSFASAFGFMASETVTETDLLFLDIEMPGINGNDFLKTFTTPPLTIFVTAYPEYALEGYELNVLDYLLKPVKFERFFQACLKAQEYYGQSGKTKKTEIWIKADNALHKILFDDIVYVNSLQNYVQIHTLDRSYTVLKPLKELISQLTPSFIQSHKSYVIHKKHIKSIEGNTVFLTKGEAFISRSYKTSFLEAVTSDPI